MQNTTFYRNRAWWVFSKFYSYCIPCIYHYLTFLSSCETLPHKVPVLSFLTKPVYFYRYPCLTVVFRSKSSSTVRYGLFCAVLHILNMFLIYSGSKATLIVSFRRLYKCAISVMDFRIRSCRNALYSGLTRHPRRPRGKIIGREEGKMAVSVGLTINI